MRQFLIFWLFIAFSNVSCFGQWGSHIAQMRPLGELGMIFERQIGFGITYQNAFDDGRRAGVDFSFFKMRPRMDEFPIVGTVTSGNSTFVSLGTQSFQRYNLFFFDAYYDWAILERDKFQFYAGGGINIGAASVEYESDSPTISSESYSGGGSIGGLFLRLGYDYYLTDQFTLALSGSRRIYFQEDAGIFGDYVYRFVGTYHF
jgi:hypothetical protein